MDEIPESGDGENSKAKREKMVQDMIALLDKTP